MTDMTEPTSSPLWNATLWFLDKTQEVVTVLTAAAIIYTKFAPGAVYFTAGAVMASRVAKGLKLLIREQRPANSTQKEESYGMPSTHSAVIIYYATYVTIASSVLPPEIPYSTLPSPFPLLIVVPWAMAIAVSRIWLGHHTLKQVLAGSTVGVVWGIGWFWWWQNGADRLTEDTLRYILPKVLPRGLTMYD